MTAAAQARHRPLTVGSRQALDMLGRRRRSGQMLIFGQNMIPDGPGIIWVGDPVQILERASADTHP